MIQVQRAKTVVEPSHADSVASTDADGVQQLHNDSVRLTDSVDVIGSRCGFVISQPPAAKATPREFFSAGSWIILGLIILLVAVSLRIRNNARYLGTLVRDLTEVRLRGNLFDDTVKETSLLFMLAILWSCSGGVLLYYLLLHLSGTWPTDSLSLPILETRRPECIGICMGMCLAYVIVMTVAYYVVGNVFSDSSHSREWVKGFLAEQGISTIGLLPLALMSICYPGSTVTFLWLAAIVFALGKIIFIIKGFRIFFTQISSWVLFLYYLCSLEIVPLVIVPALSWKIISII